MIQKRSESGNAILAVTLASMGVASAILVISKKVTSRAKSIQSVQTRTARDQLFKNLRALAKTPAAIQASTTQSNLLPNLKDGNVELANCLSLSGDLDCKATGDSTFVGFELLDEFQTRYSTSWPEQFRIFQIGKDGKWPATLALFSGVSFPTPRFDKNVKRCSDSANCALAPYTAFRAYCPQPVNAVTNLTVQNIVDANGQIKKLNLLDERPSECDQAEYIQFFVAVGGSTYSKGEVPKQSTLIPLSTKHNFFMSSPSQLGSAPSEPDEVLMTVNEINSNGARMCPTGMSTVGMDSNGNPKCKFAINPCVLKAENGEIPITMIIPSYENGQLVCRKPFQGESCGELEAFYGVTEDGKMDCRKPKFNTGCAKDQIAITFDKTGEPVCIRGPQGQECPFSKTVVGADNQPVSSELIGFDEDGIAVCRIADVIFAGTLIHPTWKKP